MRDVGREEHRAGDEGEVEEDRGESRHPEVPVGVQDRGAHRDSAHEGDVGEHPAGEGGREVERRGVRPEA